MSIPGSGITANGDAFVFPSSFHSRTLISMLSSTLCAAAGAKEESALNTGATTFSANETYTAALWIPPEA